jgi:hypothetical protein
VKDSLVLRRFCRVYFEDVPDDTTLIRWGNQIKPETLKALHERVVGLATELKVTKGRKLRTDGTVVETNIHYPTDSSLLNDGVRVLSRHLKRAQKVLAAAVEMAKTMFRDRRRSARYLKREIERVARLGQQITKPLYQKLVQISRATLKQAQQAVAQLETIADTAADGIRQTLQTSSTGRNRLSIRQYDGFSVKQACPLETNWSACLSRIPMSSNAAKPSARPSLVTRFGWMRWMVALSAITVFWMAIPLTVTSGKLPLITILTNLAKHPIKPVLIVACSLHPTKLMPTSAESNGWFCPKRGTNPSNDDSMNISPGFSVGDDTMQVSKGVSVS